jgi:hypothetical protein
VKTETSSAILLAAMGAALLFVPTVAFGWGPIITHPGIVTSAFNDPQIDQLAHEYWGSSANANISAVDGFQGDLFGVHHNEYSAFQSRLWTSSSWWSDVPDEITKLQYLGHNCGDSAVPVDHYPANTVFVDATHENLLEPQVEANSGYQHSVTGTATYSGNVAFSYIGTYAEVMNAHYNAVRANANWFKNAPYGLLDISASNHTAGWTGVTQGAMFARVVFADYFLSKKPTIANAGTTYRARPGGSVTFHATGSQDPDSVSWAGNGTFSNDGGGLVGYSWDLNGDGNYGDATGASPTMSYSDLVKMDGYTAGRTIGLRVTDNEGSIGYANATLTVDVPEPGALVLLICGGLAVLFVGLSRRLRR